MSPEGLKAKLNIDDALVSISENGGYLHVHIDREHNGTRYRFNANVAKDAGHEQITAMADDIKAWWDSTTASQ